MSKRTGKQSLYHLALAITASVLLPAQAMAEEDFNLWQEETDNGDDFSFGFAEEDAPEPPTNYQYRRSEFGVIYVDSDNFQFGGFNGQDGHGWYPLLDWSSGSTRDPESGYFHYFNLAITGPDNKELRLDWGNAPLFDQEIHYRQFQTYGNSSGFTPYINPGDETLQLPELWQGGMTTGDMSGLGESLTPLHPVLQRNQFELAHTHKLNNSWFLEVDVSAEKKEGMQLTGGAIYFNVANPHSAILPEPVNYRTNDISVGVSYQGERLISRAGYQISLFDNHREHLIWQNPYDNIISAEVDYPRGYGAKELAPDNQHHQLRFNGGYHLSNINRLEWDLSWGVSRQNEPFEPYSVNEQLQVAETLPADRLDARVDHLNLDLALLLKPLSGLSIDARYRHRSRDNQNDRYEFLYIRGDGQDQPEDIFGVYNYRVGRETNQLSIHGDYRLPRSFTVKAGYEHEQTERRNYAVSTNRESRYSVGLRSRTLQAITIDVSYEYSDRYASEYDWAYDFYALHNAQWINTIPDNQRYINHPWLRQYPIANREQDRWDISLQAMAGPAWNISARLQGKWQDYDATQLGLRKSDSLMANLQTSYAAGERWSCHAYLQFSRQDDEQAGLQFLGGADKAYNDITPPLFQASDPERVWYSGGDTTALALGLGGSIQLEPEKTELIIDYVFTDTHADYQLRAAGADDIDTGNLPAAEYRIHQVSAELRWQWQPDSEIRFGYGYYRFEETDWAYDGVQTDTLGKVITTGQQPANEAVNVLTTSIIYEL